jgi:hypothetical protein
MQWWNDFVAWFTSTDARAAVFSAAVLFVALIISGLLAALIARGTVKGMLNRTDRAQKVAAIAALVDTATEASVWNSLTPQEQVLSDRAVGQADIQVRLLPIKGAAIAANWSSHQLAEMKRNSANFGYQLNPAIAEFRDRLIEWQNRPGRARKIFEEDLERWSYDGGAPAVSGAAQAEAAPVPATTPIAPLGVQTPPDQSAPVTAPIAGADTQTQQLIDDVRNIDSVRSAAREETVPEFDDTTDLETVGATPPPVPAHGKPTGLDGSN